MKPTTYPAGAGSLRRITGGAILFVAEVAT